ncbi:AAA family ATPase [Erythrobacter sp. NE805]|uniref:AAA family ATPase n=1 Tax=Erythrobacter sp. NE805 TaxID=3389875 RepID=UPI00396B2812
MIHGYPGVGKTSLAYRLEQEYAAIRVTHDEWMTRLFGFDPPAEHFADHAARVSAQIEAVWTRCLALGMDVVLDLNFWSPGEREEISSSMRDGR